MRGVVINHSLYVSIASCEFRFNSKFPRLPDVPRVSDDELEYRCYPLPATDINSTPVHSSSSSHPTPIYQLDSVLFFTSYQPHLHSSLFSAVAAAASTSSLDSVNKNSFHEYREPPSKNSDKDATSGRQASTTMVENPINPTSVFSFSDVTDGINCDVLRTVFFISDVLILIYRMTRTCWTVRVLRHRFERCRCSNGNQLSRMRCRDGSMTSSVVRFDAAIVDGGVTGDMTSLASRSAPIALSDSQYRMQPCCHGDITNIYTDPQTLSVQNKIANSYQCSSSGRNNTAKRIGERITF